MMERKSFTFQLLIMGGFFFFFYMFFALATSIYHDYRLQSQITSFQAEINDLADQAGQKPSDLKYLESPQYKDLYAKENLNLLDPGEKVIVLPDPQQNVEQGPVQLMTEALSPDSVLNQPNNRQWWDYFFGQTLSVSAGSDQSPASNTPPGNPTPAEKNDSSGLPHAS